MKCLFHHTRVLEKGTREEHAFPATRPAAYKKNLGEDRLVVVVGLQQRSQLWWAPSVVGSIYLCVCVCVCLCFVCC